ncbi:hypothetical protein VSX61_10105 [Brenneria populi subsp. brevivirga]|uniref:hypothetical protein n=1 Tax=Brenneria populi TaxID=1505588 RepID=UPI002E199EFA|nr:hypothetical protein [Brenneria populi subsp. brevivirga]
MKVKSLALGLVLSVFSFTSSAVDGYKGVKFGSDVKTVLAAKWCNFKKYNENETKGLDAYYCENFKLSGKDSLAMAIFLDGKFERLSLTLNIDINSVIAALEKKYGNASSASTPEEVKKAMELGGSIYIRYDNDTVIVIGSRDIEAKKDYSQLVYTSPDYDKRLSELQAKELDNDL